MIFLNSGVWGVSTIQTAHQNNFFEKSWYWLSIWIPNVSILFQTPLAKFKKSHINWVFDNGTLDLSNFYVFLWPFLIFIKLLARKMKWNTYFACNWYENISCFPQFDVFFFQITSWNWYDYRNLHWLFCSTMTFAALYEHTKMTKSPPNKRECWHFCSVDQNGWKAPV